MLRRVMKAAAVGDSTDPYWANVVSASHFDGTPGATGFTDEKGVAWTRSGSGVISATESKFGGTSLYMPGGTSRFSTTANIASLGNSDYTYSCWVNFVALNALNPIFSYCTYNSSVTPRMVVLATNTGAVRFYASSGATSHSIVSSGGVVVTNQWHYVEAVKSGTDAYLSVDGVIVASTSAASGLGAGSNKINLASGYYTAAAYSNAYLDDFRATHGVARHTANFTPPGSPFPNS